MTRYMLQRIADEKFYLGREMPWWNRWGTMTDAYLFKTESSAISTQLPRMVCNCPQSKHGYGHNHTKVCRDSRKATTLQMYRIVAVKVEL